MNQWVAFALGYKRSGELCRVALGRFQPKLGGFAVFDHYTGVARATARLCRAVRHLRELAGNVRVHGLL